MHGDTHLIIRVGHHQRVSQNGEMYEPYAYPVDGSDDARLYQSLHFWIDSHRPDKYVCDKVWSRVLSADGVDMSIKTSEIVALSLGKFIAQPHYTYVPQHTHEAGYPF